MRSRVADVAYTFGRAGDDSAIDDATAEVFAALLSNDAAALKAFAGRSSLGTYVAVIATRSATRGFARRRLTPVSPGKILELDSGRSRGGNSAVPRVTEQRESEDPANEVIRTEQRLQLYRLLERLPQKQRDVVELFHLKGNSYSEISDQLSIPIGSIGPTLRRAEIRLRQWIEEESG